MMTRLFPTAPFDLVRGDVDRLVSRVFENFAGQPTRRRAFPALNVWEKDDVLNVEAELPGLKLEDLEILVQGDELTLKGRRQPAEQPDATLHRQERASGEFTRTVAMPFPIDAERVEATLRDGILSIRLPKAPEARARRIEVKSA